MSWQILDFDEYDHSKPYPPEYAMYKNGERGNLAAILHNEFGPAIVEYEPVSSYKCWVLDGIFLFKIQNGSRVFGTRFHLLTWKQLCQMKILYEFSTNEIANFKIKKGLNAKRIL